VGQTTKNGSGAGEEKLKKKKKGIAKKKKTPPISVSNFCISIPLLAPKGGDGAAGSKFAYFGLRPRKRAQGGAISPGAVPDKISKKKSPKFFQQPKGVRN